MEYKKGEITLKKTYIILLMSALLLVSCGSSDSSSSNSDSTTTTTSSATTTTTTTSSTDSDTQTTTTTTSTTNSETTTTTSSETTSSETETNTTTSEVTTTPSETTTSTTTTTKKPTTTTTTTTKKPILTEKDKNAKIEVKKNIEVYDELTINDLVTSTNVKIQNGKNSVNTSKTGKNSAVIKYTYNGKTYEHSIDYTVSDTTKPLLLNGAWNITLEKGESFVLDEWVGYVDNYDKEPVLTYTGKVDVNTVGTYPITATVTDSSGNKTSWDITIEVVNEIPKGDYTPSESMPFKEMVENYSGDGISFGIDVSKWQGDIDFEKVKAEGCSFVIIRIGSYYDDYTLDPYFEQNIKNAKAAGLKVGVYIYTTANTTDEIKDNVKWINKTLNGQKLDLPVVFDWESFSNFQQYNMSIYDLNALYELFDDELEAIGLDAMIYGSKNRFVNFWNDFSDEHPIWLAHYTAQTDYEGRYDMWQMSCTGRIDGIYGDVDMNILYNQDLFID